MLNIDAGVEVDPTLGGPCEDDGQCDDGVGCTVDHCDLQLLRCRFVPDDTICDDGIYCDGAERCDIRDDCVEGEVVACSDNTTCTIDVCIEETQSCRHDPRDADGDGDPTRNCGGHDCNDNEPTVNSQATEICGNGRDDNCDDQVDEAGCAAPEYDSCETALVVTESGYYDIDLTATALDYPTACATESASYRDAVMQIMLPDGGPFDVDVTAKLDSACTSTRPCSLVPGTGDQFRCYNPELETPKISDLLSDERSYPHCRRITLGTANSCGDLDSTSCEPSFVAPLGDNVARMVLRGVSQGSYPVYVAADREATTQVHVRITDAQATPGERCENAVPLVAAGPPQVLRLPDYAADVASACQPLTGDAFVSFSLDQASDVTLIADALNGLGLPVLSLLDANCKGEITCRRSQPGRLFERNLAPGQYRVLVAGTGPDDVSVRLETAPASEAPPGEGCAAALPLENGVEQVVDLSTHEDAVFPRCLVGAPDATFQLDLAGKRDVALIGRFSDGDEGSISLANDSCSDNSACRVGGGTVRSVSYGVPAGNYRAVIESARGNPVGISWFDRPAVAEVSVPFADDCDGVVKIPEVGGRFIGNTTNAFADFSAGCDVGGQSDGGARDQILELELSEARRVILDMQGSGYQTMLSVREGEFCPGVELPLACAAGYRSTRSYLDLDLQAGHYFVQIDGYDGAAGPWRLDVFTAPL